MTKIIGISGRKQSGKNTAANYIAGDIFKTKNMVSDFYISELGKLIINTQNRQGETGWGELDLLRHDEEFCSYADNFLWPFCKIYHFADPLKAMCVDFFDLSPKQVYGTDEDKNTETPYSQNGWNHKMTSREFLQYFGTEVMRKIKDTIWVDYTIKKISIEKTEIAIIPDVRFPNEIEAIKNAGGVVIRLDRDVLHGTHECETALDKDKFEWNQFNYVLSNNDKNIKDFLQDLSSLENLWR